MTHKEAPNIIIEVIGTLIEIQLSVVNSFKEKIIKNLWMSLVELQEVVGLKIDEIISFK